VKKKNHAHNATNQLRALYDKCEWTKHCTKDDRHLFQTLSDLLYSNAKQAEPKCKKVGQFAWSQMLVSAGKMVQYANEEYRRWKNHEFSESNESNDDAFARAKQNQSDAYIQIN
jgi:alpha-galactosidase/6-phospho-beta-glucosidase family protein